MAASYLIWLWEPGYAGLAVFAAIMGAAYGGWVAISPSVLAELFGTEGLGGTTGALYTGAGIGALFGPPLAGFVVDATGSYRPGDRGGYGARGGCSGGDPDAEAEETERMRRYPPFDDDVQITPLRLPTPPRGTWFVLGAIGVLIVILAVAGPAIAIATGLLWFKALGIQEVYTTRLGLQLWLFFGSLLVAFACRRAVCGRAFVSRQLGPPDDGHPAPLPAQRTAGLVGIVAAFIIALIVSLGAQRRCFFLDGGPTGRS